MEVTNVSGVPHRYVALDGHRWIWAPGETRDVPEDVAEMVLATHEGGKMMRGRLASPSPQPSPVEGEGAEQPEGEGLTAYEDRQMVPNRPRRKR